MGEQVMSLEERSYLRDLAKRQLEYANSSAMRETEARWYRHNDLQGGVPMVHFETGTCEGDLLPQLKCTSDAARGLELTLIRNVLNHERIGDDRVVPAYLGLGWFAGMALFDISVKREHVADGHGGNLGHQFIHPIKDLKEDLRTLKPSRFSVDRDATLKWKAYLEELFGDILPVRMGCGSLVASLSQHVVHLMGMEAMIFAMVDFPEEFHAFMSRIADDHIAYMKWLEAEGLLFHNSGNDWLGQGTFGFTRSLPPATAASSGAVRTTEMWGYMDSQETVSVSPAMFAEFFYPYYKRVADNFGLLSYGCCEPVHTIWENCVSKLPNLRKVSISAWCDEEYMGQALKGSSTIFLRKPSPNFVGVGREFDEDGFREHILRTIRAAKGCTLEFAFRDVYSLGGDPEKPRRAVQIVRELLEEYWG